MMWEYGSTLDLPSRLSNLFPLGMVAYRSPVPVVSPLAELPPTHAVSQRMSEFRGAVNYAATWR